MLRRNRIFIGPLPDDSQHIPASIQQQQQAIALQQEFAGPHLYSHNAVGRLSITVVQAKLAKNYGMTRMDPYTRIRLGHCEYHTHTDPNGGKAPQWNKVLQCTLPQGVNTVSLEIYDERSFSVDELVAWTQITIPQQAIQGQTHEDWYPLTGKQGEGLEGMINLVFTYVPNSQAYKYPQMPPVTMGPNEAGKGGVMPIYPAPPTVQPILSEPELKQIEEMFPKIDKEVIKSVFEAHMGNKDDAVNSLQQMCQ